MRLNNVLKCVPKSTILTYSDVLTRTAYLGGKGGGISTLSVCLSVSQDFS